MYKILHIDNDEIMHIYLADVMNRFYDDVQMISFESWSEAKNHLQQIDLIILGAIKGADVYKEICKEFFHLKNFVIHVTSQVKFNMTNLDSLLETINEYRNQKYVGSVSISEFW